MGASCTCATECAIVWWFQCRLLKYRETDRYREIVVTRVIQLWAASAVALLAGGYNEHWITTTSLKRVEQITKSIVQEHCSRDSWQSSHIILSGFLEECYMCHMLVSFYFYFFFNSCTYQSMQSDPIITSDLYFSVSHHTVAALFVPPHGKKPFESILARSVFRTLASGSSDMYRIEYFAVGMRDSNLYANAQVWRNQTWQWHIRKALGLQMWWHKNKKQSMRDTKTKHTENKCAIRRH